MTTPNDPHDDRFDHPENRPDNQYPSYPSYPSTPHPEDAPGYGEQPYQPYQGYQGYAGYRESAPHGGGQPTGDGKVRPMEAVSWAFGQTFRNWQVWILGALALGVAVFALSIGMDVAFGGPSADLAYQAGFGYQAAQAVMGLILGVLSIFIYHGALRQVDKEKMGFGDFTGNVNFWSAFGVFVVIQVISGIILSLVIGPILMGGNEIANMQMATQDEALATLSRLFAGLMIVLFLALLVAPLTMFMVWFAVDRRAGFGGAFGAGLRAGARNYLPLLLFTFVSGVAAMVLAMVTFGLAMIVIGPALLLAQAHLYRQAAQGPLPAPRP